jgi:lipoprotein-anchoring transpeptidase ErfK/SrfK
MVFAIVRWSGPCMKRGVEAIVRLIGLLAIIITSSLLGTFASNSAPKIAQASVSEKSGQVWSLQTPFGVIYEIIARQEVDYPSTRPAGTIVVNTRERRLYYLLGRGKAIRYGIAVGMEGYGWSGVSRVAAKREWPDWTPTPDILKRHPNLPRHMVGGPDNPLGARALYLGGTLYRIHGTNEPWRLGGGVSSGCIRLSNDDIIDLYNRTKIGATVIVQ